MNNKVAERKIDTFAPRLWRVNKELAIKLFSGENDSYNSRFPVFIPYCAETFMRWYLEEELNEIENTYWDYVELCELIRGERATNCRAEDSNDYLKPFDLQHYNFYKFKKKNFVIGR
jgi:hypothetical protein